MKRAVALSRRTKRHFFSVSDERREQSETHVPFHIGSSRLSPLNMSRVYSSSAAAPSLSRVSTGHFLSNLVLNFISFSESAINKISCKKNLRVRHRDDGSTCFRNRCVDSYNSIFCLDRAQCGCCWPSLRLRSSCPVDLRADAARLQV